MRYAPQIVFGGFTGDIYFNCFDLDMFIKIAVYSRLDAINCELDERTPFSVRAVIEYAPTKQFKAVVLKFICTVASAHLPWRIISSTPSREPDFTVN